MEGSVLCFGNPLLDMSVTLADDGLMKKYDLKPSNAILAEEKHVPIYAELEGDKTLEFIAGGAGQNTTRVAQWMLGTPQACVYVGSVGKDENGKRLKAACEADGVRVHYQVTDDQPTGTCAVLVHDQERTMVANLGAANHYKIDHFNQADTQKIVADAKHVYISSFFLTVSPETANKVGAACNAGNKTLMMNLAAPFLVEVPIFLERVDALIAHADFVFGNEHEAAALGKAKGWGDDLTEIAKRLQKVDGRPDRVVVFTHGEKPAIVVSKGGAVQTFPPTLLEKKDIVDLNGAGDAFCGGFLAAHAKGQSLADAMKAGHWAATQIIKVSGCKVTGKCSYF